MRLRAIAATIITTVATATFAVVGASPASAAVPVVVSPVNGGSLPTGSTGPLIIDFPTSGNYILSVKCGDRDYFWWNGAALPYSGRQSIPIDPLEGFGEDLGGATCQVEVTGGSPYATTLSTFVVASPPLTLGAVRATKAKFYPLVKDDYLDETEFVFSVNRKADATLTVTDEDGKTVDSRSAWLDSAGEYRMAWDGRTSGKTLKPGRYRATVTAVADGTTLEQSTTVRVATKKVLRRETLRREHWDSNDTTRGNCRTDFDDEVVLLDCWGGAYARSTFNFKIPADATSIQWGARTSYTTLDKTRGRITKTGNQVGKVAFQVRVQVTGWRAVNVHGAWVSYKARIQF